MMTRIRSALATLETRLYRDQDARMAAAGATVIRTGAFGLSRRYQARTPFRPFPAEDWNL